MPQGRKRARHSSFVHLPVSVCPSCRPSSLLAATLGRNRYQMGARIDKIVGAHHSPHCAALAHRPLLTRTCIRGRLFGLGSETQATWLRNNNETSPVLGRLYLRRKLNQFNKTCHMQESVQRIENYLKTTKATRRHEGRKGHLSPQAHQVHHQKCDEKLASQHNSKGLAAHVPSPSYLSPNSLSCYHSPSSVRKKALLL